ncbi:MAG: hypothetical protein ACOX0E_02425 [Syntrophomonadaceae bacterium]
MSSCILPGYAMEKKFLSKKNNVFLFKRVQEGQDPEFLVYKKYSRKDRMAKELEIFQRLSPKGVLVPKVYGTGDDYVLLEYLEGNLLLDLWERQEAALAVAGSSLNRMDYGLISPLCCWFKDFYIALQGIDGRQMIMGDVNFRNFIVNNRIYGIDLEECREGKIEEDVGSLCAFALTYRPAFTSWKIAMVRELLRNFIGEFKLDPELVQKEVSNQLLFLAQIRGTLTETEKILTNNWLGKTIFLEPGSGGDAVDYVRADPTQ